MMAEIPPFLLRLNNCEKVSKLTRGSPDRKEGSQLGWKWETLTTRLILFVVSNAFWLLWLWTHQLCDWWKLIWNYFLSFYADLVSMQITLNAFLKNTKFLCLPLNFQMVKNNCVPPEQDFNRAIAVEQWILFYSGSFLWVFNYIALQMLRIWILYSKIMLSELCYLKPSSTEEWFEMDTNSFDFFLKWWNKMVESVYGLLRKSVGAKKVTIPNAKSSFCVKCEMFQNMQYFCYADFYHSSLHGLRFSVFFSCCIHHEFLRNFSAVSLGHNS